MSYNVNMDEPEISFPSLRMEVPVGDLVASLDIP
jgi:hypothetical protein